jgi:hypothetical protein
MEYEVCITYVVIITPNIRCVQLLNEYKNNKIFKEDRFWELITQN